MSEPLTPSGCRHCGIDKLDHAQRYTTDAGWHQWTAPTTEQIKARMLARRNATQQTLCWIVTDRGNRRHWPTRQQAEADATQHTTLHTAPTVTRSEQPCIAIQCANPECEAYLGEDEGDSDVGGVWHFATQAEADESISRYGWQVTDTGVMCGYCAVTVPTKAGA